MDKQAVIGSIFPEGPSCCQDRIIEVAEICYLRLNHRTPGEV